MYHFFSRGTCQGCALSPPIFLLTIKPLAIAVRAHPTVEGVVVEQEKHVISLYADDIMLYLTNIPALCNLLDDTAVSLVIK